MAHQKRVLFTEKQKAEIWNRCSVAIGLLSSLALRRFGFPSPLSIEPD